MEGSALTQGSVSLPAPGAGAGTGRVPYTNSRGAFGAVSGCLSIRKGSLSARPALGTY